MVNLAPDEIGMFLGGLLSVLVRNRAHELAGDMSDEDWARERRVYLETAYEDVVMAFPEPLRSKLRGDRDAFLTAAMGLN